MNEDTLEDLELSIDEALHLLYVATKYDVAEIRIACREFIKEGMTFFNVVRIHETLQSRNEEELELTSFNFMVE